MDLQLGVANGMLFTEDVYDITVMCQFLFNKNPCSISMDCAMVWFVVSGMHFYHLMRELFGEMCGGCISDIVTPSPLATCHHTLPSAQPLPTVHQLPRDLPPILLCCTPINPHASTSYDSAWISRLSARTPGFLHHLLL